MSYYKNYAKRDNRYWRAPQFEDYLNTATAVSPFLSPKLQYVAAATNAAYRVGRGAYDIYKKYTSLNSKSKQNKYKIQKRAYQYKNRFFPARSYRTRRKQITYQPKRFSQWSDRGMRDLKYLDYTNINNTTPDVIPDVGVAPFYQKCLNRISAGTSQNQRIGIDINAKYLDLSGKLIFSSASSAVTVRTMVIYDRWCNRAVDYPTKDVLFESSAERSPITSPLNMTTYRGRFQVLMDWMYVFDYSDSAALEVPFKRRFYLNNLRIHFNGSALTDYSRNSIFFIIFADVPGGIFKLTTHLVYWG